jgi:hypothetical protein
VVKIRLSQVVNFRLSLLPRPKAIDLIAQETDIYGSKTPEELVGETLFGMVLVITDEKSLTLGD